MENYNYTIVSFCDDDNPRTTRGEFKQKWHSTDGWRGYNVITATKKSGWEHLHEDWMTGNYDDAGDHADVKQAEKFKLMAEELAKTGEELAVVFSPTSNVFSTGVDIFKRKIIK